MVSQAPRRGRNPVLILGLTVLVLAVFLGGGHAVWKARKAMQVRRALAEGTAAYERGDWQTAAMMLGRYDGAHPDDAD
ncbi:MAG: hypothetical protein AB1716_17680, partial [Planctomycetota bacterium]